MNPGQHKELLECTGIVAGYRPDLPILNGVSVAVNRAELVTIIGPNGAGKSTLIKAIAGLLTLSAGAIHFNGRPLTDRLGPALVAAGISYVPQTQNIFTSLSVHHNLCLAAHCLVRPKTRLGEIYDLFPILAEKRHARGRTLSGGQRQILAIAMALIRSPSLIMLDEPSAGLAPKVAADIFDRLQVLVKNGVAVLLVEQNAKAALAISDRAYVLAGGRNKLHGSGQALLEDAAVAEVYLGARRVES